MRLQPLITSIALDTRTVMALLTVLQRLASSRATVCSPLLSQTPWGRSLTETNPCSSASCKSSEQPPHTTPRCKGCLHTSAAAPRSADGLEEVLRKKSELQEAGQGCIVIDPVKDKLNKSKFPGGCMELRVPYGTNRVLVRVSLDSVQDGETTRSVPYRFGCDGDGRIVSSPPDQCTTGPQTTDQGRLMASKEKQQSWFSIKDIRNKLPGCRREVSAPAQEQPPRSTCPTTRPPCPPSPPACPPSRPTKNTAVELSPTSKRPPVCGQKAQKPECNPRKCSSAVMLLSDAVVVSS